MRKYKTSIILKTAFVCSLMSCQQFHRLLTEINVNVFYCDTISDHLEKPVGRQSAVSNYLKTSMWFNLKPLSSNRDEEQATEVSPSNHTSFQLHNPRLKKKKKVQPTLSHLNHIQEVDQALYSCLWSHKLYHFFTTF